jgi:hypothetical protein
MRVNRSGVKAIFVGVDLSFCVPGQPFCRRHRHLPRDNRGLNIQLVNALILAHSLVGHIGGSVVQNARPL